eukprot:COSAG04_NODE_112_length_25760_cov_5.835977_4_plen_201_part_00
MQVWNVRTGRATAFEVPTDTPLPVNRAPGSTVHPCEWELLVPRCACGSPHARNRLPPEPFGSTSPRAVGTSRVRRSKAAKMMVGGPEAILVAKERCHDAASSSHVQELPTRTHGTGWQPWRRRGTPRRGANRPGAARGRAVPGGPWRRARVHSPGFFLWPSAVWAWSWGRHGERVRNRGGDDRESEAGELNRWRRPPDLC